jgi:hypothetical protein
MSDNQELSTNFAQVTPGAIRQEIKAKLDLIQELLDTYEHNASIGTLTEEEAIHLDILIDEQKKLEVKLSEFDKKVSETIVLLETAKSDNDIFTRGKRTFHDIADAKGEAQLENSITAQREIRVRRTREEIENYYKEKIKLLRPNLRNIYSVNSLLRTLGIKKNSRHIYAFEKEYLNKIISLREKLYEII